MEREFLKEINCYILKTIIESNTMIRGIIILTFFNLYQTNKTTDIITSMLIIKTLLTKIRESTLKKVINQIISMNKST